MNATFAHMLFGNAPAVGRHFLLFRATHPKEIVGVVEDGKYQSLTEEPQPAMFFPLAQERNSNDTVLVVRSGLQPAEMTASLNRIVTDINPGLPFVVRSWRDALDLALFPARAATVALGIMGVLAAMLAITGIFGMAAYSVSRRMKELGIRVALGAARVQLIRAALGRPLVLLFLGSATGLISGVLASRLLAQVVYEATPGDPFGALRRDCDHDSTRSRSDMDSGTTRYGNRSSTIAQRRVKPACFCRYEPEEMVS